MAARDFKGIWIPKEVWLSRELTLQEKVFYVEINSLDNEDGCWANNEYFASFFGISKVRVSEVTADVNQQMGNKRTLKTLANFSLRPSQTNIEDPHKDSFKHSNTFSNTENNILTGSKEPVTQKEIFPSYQDLKNSAIDCQPAALQEKKEKKVVRKKKEKEVDPFFPEFVRVWTEAYPEMGFDGMAGKKIKSLVAKTKAYLVAGGKDPSTAVQMWAYIIAYMKRGDTWFHGKDLGVIESKFNSLVFEIKNGKQKQSPRTRTTTDALNDLIKTGKFNQGHG
jgi:hypothetical protein